MTAIDKNMPDLAHTVSGSGVFKQVVALSSQGIKRLLENMFKKPHCHRSVRPPLQDYRTVFY